MATLLDIAELSHAYGDRLAVKGVSFHVDAGEVFGLLGPNGAGKTTTIGCLCGLTLPRSGTMTFDGRPFDPARDPDDRARLGLVPQDLALYDDLTGRENLTFFATVAGADGVADRVDEGLALAGLAARADDRVRSYSGGMKRRLNLAAGTLHDPALLLLDEPTVGVDPQSRNHLFEAIEALAARGRSILYTSHSMGEVERLCDRIAIMDEGDLVATGTAEELAATAGVPGADLERTFLELTGRSLRDDAS